MYYSILDKFNFTAADITKKVTAKTGLDYDMFEQTSVPWIIASLKRWEARHRRSVFEDIRQAAQDGALDKWFAKFKAPTQTIKRDILRHCRNIHINHKQYSRFWYSDALRRSATDIEWCAFLDISPQEFKERVEMGDFI